MISGYYLLCQHWYPQLFLSPLATALFYFSLGGYLGRKKIYFPDLFRRWMGLWGTFLVLLLLTMLGYMSYVPTLYIPFGVLAVLASAEHIFDRLPKVKAYCLAREGQVFFIYAVHLIFIENWIKGAFSRTPLAHSGWGPGPTHDLARTLLPLVLREHYFIFQGALAHH